MTLPLLNAERDRHRWETEKSGTVDSGPLEQGVSTTALHPAIITEPLLNTASSADMLSPMTAPPAEAPVGIRPRPKRVSIPELDTISGVLPGSPPDLQDNPMYRANAAMSTTPFGASAYLAADMHAAASVTLPDAGNLFVPMRDVINGAAPLHMRETAAELCLATHQLDDARLTGDQRIYTADAPLREPKRQISGLSEAAQEALLVQDLLTAFMGLETDYLRLTKAVGPRKNRHLLYMLPPRLARALSDVLCSKITPMLPIAESVLLITRYAESRLAPEFGSVCNALARSLVSLLDDWDIFLASLEHTAAAPRFGLEALRYHCEPAAGSLHLAATVCADASARKLCGAALLDLLHARAVALAGDPRAARVLHRLLHAASVPYFAMLTTWVSTGALDDPFSEFMVHEVPGMDMDREVNGEVAFWAARHTIRQREAPDGGVEDDVPVLLQDVAMDVLKAGKNWAILRQCTPEGDGSSRAPLVPGNEGDGTGRPTPIEYDSKRHFVGAVQAQLRAASTLLLREMMGRFRLESWLRTVKSFFLLAQGDFLANFLDIAATELYEKVERVSQQRLRSLLELAVKTSSLSRDEHHEHLLLTLDSKSFIELHAAAFRLKGKDKKKMPTDKLEALELLMLSLRVSWPISIVLSPHALHSYQFCFRHLVNCKNVERMLGDMWSVLTRVRMLRVADKRSTRAQTVLQAALSLIHRMLFFVQRYLHYVTVEVIDPQWHIMLCAIKAAESLDDVLAAHSRCVNNILRFALLERLKTLSTIAMIWWNCRECCWQVREALRHHCGCTSAEGLRPETLLKLGLDPRFQLAISNVEEHFDMALGKLHKELKAQKQAILAGDGLERDSRHEEAATIQNFIDQVTLRPTVSPTTAAIQQAQAHLNKA